MADKIQDMLLIRKWEVVSLLPDRANITINVREVSSALGLPDLMYEENLMWIADKVKKGVKSKKMVIYCTSKTNVSDIFFISWWCTLTVIASTRQLIRTGLEHILVGWMKKWKNWCWKVSVPLDLTWEWWYAPQHLVWECRSQMWTLWYTGGQPDSTRLLTGDRKMCTWWETGRDIPVVGPVHHSLLSTSWKSWINLSSNV